MNMDVMGRRPAFPVAVVGMFGRFPGAPDVATFWENLKSGRDAIRAVPTERWDAESIFGDPDGDSELTYAKAGGFAPDVDCFDCKAFDILPREAQSMDPQQRLFLETAWSALEDAGHPPRALGGKRVGVFVGVGHADYPAMLRRDSAPFDIFRGTGIVPTAIPNRVSFAFDFHGPSEAIDTACSGSLVALHRAVQALAIGECEMAIAGGVNLLLAPELFIAFAKAGMLSRSGRCRPFDAGADGYVRGEGAIALVLRPLHLAQADNDFIYGVVRGTAVNHGGKAHSFTAPNLVAQADVVSRAWSQAGLALEEAVLIETHGTGTKLGDPIEVKGLKRALEATKRADGSSGKRRIALGALKSQIGHLEAAAGLAGVVKALMVLQHRLIPKNLNFKAQNPEIDLSGTPFFFPNENVPLERSSAKALAIGVSSFGFGGTNGHAVIEEYVSHERGTSESNEPHLFILSGRDERALRGRASQLYRALSGLNKRSSEPDAQQILDALTDALGTKAQRETRFAALSITPQALASALDAIGTKISCPISLKDVRNCITFGDVADAVAEIHASRTAPIEIKDTDHLPSAALNLAANEVSLREISFALIHGRDALEERLAIIAISKQELSTKLQDFLLSEEKRSNLWIRGSVKKKDVGDKPDTTTSAATAQKLEAVARDWVVNREARISWSEITGSGAPRKIPLPPYPFERKRIWYRSGEKAEISPSLTIAKKAIGSPHVLHSALIGLIEFLAKRGSRRLGLAEIVFSSTTSAKFDDLTFEIKVATPPTAVCKAAANNKVDIVARGRAIESCSASPWTEEIKRPIKQLEVAQFCARAARLGLPIGPDQIGKIAITDTAIVINRLEAAAGNLTWNELLGAVFTSVDFLHAISDPGGQAVPSTIQYVIFATSLPPRAALMTRQDRSSGRIDVRCIAPDRASLLEVRGWEACNAHRLSPIAATEDVSA